MRAIGALPLSLALSGLDAASVGVKRAVALRENGRPTTATDGGAILRELIEWARAVRLEGVQLDATAPGVRARDLDRSARRDLASLLRRNELVCSGLDLFIPPEHFGDARRVDRAVAGVLGAIELAADLAGLSSGSVVSRTARGRLNVSVRLPETIAPDIGATLAAACEIRGVRLADHSWPARASGVSAAIGVGFDPASAIAAGADPATSCAALGERLACARLTDVARGAPGVRAVPGAPGGVLDLLAYQVALQTAGYLGPVVLDVRGLSAQDEAIVAAARAWRKADPLVPLSGRA